MVEFKKAEKKQAKLRLALTGPSGAGKTFSGLLMASGLGKKIAVIDTENHSASLYAGEKDIPDFDTLEIEPPYTVAKYIDAIDAAVKAGFEVLVIDSITHAWAGEGGLLAQKEVLDGTGKGSSYTNWASITKEHEKFKAWLLKCDIHLIVTMRSKQDYVLTLNDKGKQQPQKIGLAPIQRDGMEYEFTMVLDMAMNHYATVSKTRAKSFDGRLFMPDRKTGQELLTWLNAGAIVEKPAAIVPDVQKAKAALIVLGAKLADIDSYIETLPFKDEKAIIDHLRGVWNSVHTKTKTIAQALSHAGAPGRMLNAEEIAQLQKFRADNNVSADALATYVMNTFGVEKPADVRTEDFPKIVDWLFQFGTQFKTEAKATSKQ